MFDKIKENINYFIAAIALIGTIGTGFVKYNEIMTKIDSVDPQKAEALMSKVNKQLLIQEKELELIKVQIKEIREANKNPLAR
jgi:hypothetical protein